VGPADTVASLPARETIDAAGGIIMPGLVNTHTHAAMTLFRGLADDLPLMDWLNDYIFPAEALLDRQKVHTGTMLACAEMILSGTTCFCDMYLFEDAVARAAKTAGMRAVVGEVLYDFPSPNYGPIEKGFDYTRRLIDTWRNDPLITIAVEPHSPYLCAPDLLTEAAGIAREHRLPLVIHLAETHREVRTSGSDTAPRRWAPGQSGCAGRQPAGLPLRGAGRNGHGSARAARRQGVPQPGEQHEAGLGRLPGRRSR
jgi:5-methylthioadenosine/S-adenosylhomocysteine deaminase